MTQIHLISASTFYLYEGMQGCLRFYILHTNWQLSREMEESERESERERDREKVSEVEMNKK